MRARWGGVVAWRAKGSGPPPLPDFPGYAGPGGKGNRGHPDFPRLRAAPVPRGQDAAKRDSPQQVRLCDPRVGRRRCGGYGAGMWGIGFGGRTEPARARCCSAARLLALGSSRRGLGDGFGTVVEGQITAYGGSTGCQFMRYFSRRDSVLTLVGQSWVGGGM